MRQTKVRCSGVAGGCSHPGQKYLRRVQRDLFIDNLLVRIHLIIAMIRWPGLAPWELELSLPRNLTSTCSGSTLNTLNKMPCARRGALFGGGGRLQPPRPEVPTE